MNVRIALVILAGLLQANLVVSECSAIQDILKLITLGLVKICDDDPEGPGDVDDELPSGLINVVCKNLVNVMGGVLADQVDLGDEINGVIDSIECGCAMDGLRDIKVGCNIPEPICVEFETGDNTVQEICGEPQYRGTLERPLRITGKKPNLLSAACVKLSGGTADSMSKLCVEADHKDGFTEIAKLDSCTIYAVRQNGKIDTCNSCTPCDGDLSVKFDCSNIDLDESPDRELILPSFADECFATGLLSTGDLKGETGSYVPFLTKVN